MVRKGRLLTGLAGAHKRVERRNVPLVGTMNWARQYFQKRRSFKTEAEGVSKGFEYPLNVEDRLIMRAERSTKPSLIDGWHRIKTLEDVGVKSRCTRRHRYSNQLSA